MSRRRTVFTAVLTAVVALAVAVALVARYGSSKTSSGAAHTGKLAATAPSMAVADRSALAGRTFFVDPNGHAASAHRLLLALHKPAEAARIATIARQPTGVWFTGETLPAVAAAQLTEAASRMDRTALTVLYDIPQRDCGQQSAGGATGPAQYLSYVNQFASGLRGPSVIVLEPDAIPFALKGCAGLDSAQRYRLLGQAVDVLRKRPAVKVYLDAGNAGWVSDLGALAKALRASGVERAAGFALNVSNYDRTDDTVAYGRRLSDLLNGSHFVIDTSRNGAGPLTDGNPLDWCNPAGRRLGTAPTTNTEIARVDAFLWVKQPGDSDGQCGPGQPRAGQWWETGALALVG